MNRSLKAIAAASCVMLAFLNANAQHVTKEQIRESLQETLKEKLRPARELSVEPETGRLFKTTATDQKLTGNSATSVQEAEVSVAVHPADSNKVVVSYMEETSSGLKFPIYYSSNGGQTWTKSSFNTQTILASDFPGQLFAGGGDPVFAWDKTGRLYFSWIYLSALPSFDTAFFTLNYAFSDNNGQTWTVPAGDDHFIGRGAIDLFGGNLFDFKDGVCDRQWMSVDNTNGPNQGKLYCSFLLQPGDPNAANMFGTCVKTKMPGSSAFGPAVNVINDETQFGNVEVDKNGVVHVSFASLTSDAIMHASSANGGTSFSAAHFVGQGFNLFGGNNTIHDRENAAANLAVDGLGNLHVVYSSFPNASMVESFYVRSTDGGVNWSTPLNLSTMFGNQKTLMPVVAASGDNVTVSLTVIDNSDSARYLQLNSVDDGQNFSSIDTISSASTYYPHYTTNDFFGDYNRSVRTNCRVYTAWSDGRNNAGPKIYFARTNYCTTGTREITTVNAGIEIGAPYPNPAKERISLQVSAREKTEIELSLSDISGRTIQKEHFTLNRGAQEISFRFGRQHPGIYILSLGNGSGIVATRQLIID